MSRLAQDPRVYQNKADGVYDALRAEFVDGDWPFGQTFSVYELAERFGVSRPLVMDAVRRLQSDGFVEIIPQVGCRVVSPEDTRIRENLELSAIVEGPAAYMAATRATDADVERLERIHERTRPIVEAGDGEAYTAVNREFHATILGIAGNRALASVAASAWDMREFYFHPYRHLSGGVLTERHADHGAILDAIRKRDGDAAQARMREHLDPERGLEFVRQGAEAEVQHETGAAGRAVSVGAKRKRQPRSARR